MNALPIYTTISLICAGVIIIWRLIKFKKRFGTKETLIKTFVYILLSMVSGFSSIVGYSMIYYGYKGRFLFEEDISVYLSFIPFIGIILLFLGILGLVLLLKEKK